MPRLELAYTRADASLAGRIADDALAAGYPAVDGQPDQHDPLVLILSPQTEADAGVMDAVYRALDAGRHVIPVLTAPVAVPRLLDHLRPVDFSGGYAFEPLHARLDEVTAPGAGAPLKVLTPRTRRSNRRVGLVLLVVVGLLFVFSAWAIATFDLESPAAEYERVDTEVAGTRDALIEPTLAYLATVLPRSTADAESFAPTLDAIPTRVRPFVGATATAIHDQLQQFAVTATP